MLISRRAQQAFDEAIREVANGDVVLDLGTFTRFRKELAPYRSLLAEKRYWAMDYRIGQAPEVDAPDVDGDICRLPFKSGVADGVICKDVLEHVTSPRAAVREIHRVLRHGGVVFVEIPMLHPYHGSDCDKNRDLWRFTRDAVDELFVSFDTVGVTPMGGLLSIAGAYAAALGAVMRLPIVRVVAGRVDDMLMPHNSVAGWLVVARK